MTAPRSPSVPVSLLLQVGFPLLAAAATWGVMQWRVDQTEKRADALAAKVGELQCHLAKVDLQLVSMGVPAATVATFTKASAEASPEPPRVEVLAERGERTLAEAKAAMERIQAEAAEAAGPAK